MVHRQRVGYPAVRAPRYAELGTLLLEERTDTLPAREDVTVERHRELVMVGRVPVRTNTPRCRRTN